MSNKILAASFTHDAKTGELTDAQLFKYKTLRGAKNKRDKLCTNNEGMRTIEMPEFGLTQRRDKSPDKNEDRSAVTIDVQKLLDGIQTTTMRVVQHVAAEIIEEETAHRKAQREKQDEKEVAKRIKAIVTDGQKTMDAFNVSSQEVEKNV